MAKDQYSIKALARDIKQICTETQDEEQIIRRVRPLVQRAAQSKDAWLEKRMYHTNPTQGFGVYVLYEEADHALPIIVMSWAPNRGAPPHDHGTWAVVASVDGPEKNEFYERVDDRSRPGHAELKKIGETVCGAGDVVAIPNGVIHSVRNETNDVSVSLHVYGKHINHTKRSQFNLNDKTETSFIVRLET
jgi:predicted metal-dependent enzyme (double-stranded beta helix superfamily)